MRAKEFAVVSANVGLSNVDLTKYAPISRLSRIFTVQYGYIFYIETIKTKIKDCRAMYIRSAVFFCGKSLYNLMVEKFTGIIGYETKIQPTGECFFVEKK